MRKSKIIFVLLVIVLPDILLSQSKRRIDSILNLIAIEKTDTLLVKEYYKLCWEYTTTDPAKAKEFGLKSLELATKINYKKGIAASLNNIGNIYYYSDDYGKAIDYYTQSLKVREKINDKRGMADNLNNIGVLYQSKGNYTKALDFFLKAIKISEEVKEMMGVAAGYNNIGLILSNMRNFPKAQDYYLRAVKLYDELKDDYGKASAYNNLALLYADFKKYDRALPVFMEALAINERSGDKHGAAVCYNNIAEIFREKGEFGKEKEFVNKAIELRKLVNDKEGIASSYLSLAKIALRENHFSEAIDYIQQSIGLATEIGNRHTESKGHELAAIAFAKNGNYKSAYESQLKYENLRDSLLNSEAMKDIADLQVKYETDKQQKEIELLTKEHEISLLENSKKETEINKQKIVIYSFVGLLLIIIVFSFFLYKSISAKQKANQKLELAYKQIGDKNRDILDSLNYAKRIQKTLLTPESFLKQNLPEHFIIYKPKDIVSGDFYWMHKLNDGRVFIAVADCTGHGVPGAFMSFIGTSKLNEIIIEKGVLEPAEILNRLREEIIHTTNPEGIQQESLDGMDINLCLYDFKKLRVEFAGANNSLLVVRNKNLFIYKADKFPVGLHFGEQKKFTANSIQLEKNDQVFVSTDGFADQFGGPNGKKFKYKKLCDLLLLNSNESLKVQADLLNEQFLKWKGDLEQVDDICIIGIKV